MTGESALLGRDPENVQPKRPALPPIDSEIDQTIETGFARAGVLSVPRRLVFARGKEVLLLM